MISRHRLPGWARAAATLAATLGLIAAPLGGPLGALPAFAATSPPSIAFEAADVPNQLPTIRLGRLGSSVSIDTKIVPNSEATLASDGSAVVYPAGPIDTENLTRRDTATGKTTQLTNRPGQELFPSYSPDGQRISYLYTGDSADHGATGVYVLNPATGASVRVSSSNPDLEGYAFYNGCWSHDGRRIAYAASHTDPASTNLIVANADGSGSRTVITSLSSSARALTCSWTPDDQFILMPYGADRQLYATKVATGKMTQLTHDPAHGVGSLTISNDWKVRYSDIPAGSAAFGQIRELWLGNLASSVDLFGFAGGSFGASTADTGPVLPAPAAFLAAVNGTATPPTKPAPTVTSVKIAAPSPQDTILRRGIAFTSSGGAAARYEYAWALSKGATAPTTPVQKSTTGSGSRLYFGPPNPDSTAYLFARAVGTDGTAGAWTAPRAVKIPPIPRLLFGIDSVTSGHHNDVDDNGKTTCDDPNYGYAALFAKRWLAALPAQWRGPNQVVNVAHSGFATQPRAGSGIVGSALSGGINACGRKDISPPIQDAERALELSRNSWNRWIATGGINDTNWSDVVRGIVQVNLTLENLQGRTISAKECGNGIANTWDGTKKEVQGSITGGVQQITTRLRKADPSLKITWLGYYNAAGTGTNKIRRAPYLPATCGHAFDVALSKIHAAIQAGLPSDATWIDTDSVMHMNKKLVQPLIAIQQLLHSDTDPPGWPHPNQKGAAEISNLLSV